MTTDAAAGVAIVLLVILASPLVVIWALNTLFALGIAYTFTTWLATGLLMLVVALLTNA